MFVGVPYFAITFVICSTMAVTCFFLQRRIPGGRGLFHFQLFFWLLGIEYLAMVIHQYQSSDVVDKLTDFCLAASNYFLVTGAFRHAGIKANERWMLIPSIGIFVIDQVTQPWVVYPAFLYSGGCLLLAALVLLSEGSNWGENAMAYTLTFWAALAVAFGIFAMQDLTEAQGQRFVYAFAVVPGVVALSGVFLVTCHLLDVQQLVEQDAYRSVFENSNIAIVQTDTEGRVLLANTAAEALLLPPGKDMLLQEMVELRTPLGQNPQHIPRTLVKTHGRQVPVEIHWSLVRERPQ